MDQKLPILMYHSIQKIPNTELMKSLHVHPSAFARQMWLLKILGYNVMGVNAAINAKAQNPSRKVIALTFDDGYRNFYKNALPILEKFGFSATVFILSQHLAGINYWDTPLGISPNALMSADQIIDCNKRQIEIGSHGRNHVDLTTVPLGEAKNEILASQRELENLVQTEILSFCYPFGSFNKELTEILGSSRYKSSVSMLRGRYDLKQSYNHNLPRVPINWRTTLPQFLLKIKTRYEDRRA